MGKYADIVYYPSLSIAENAALNKVQEKDIRYYIRSRGIDRRNEERQPYISKIKDYINEHPNATRKETADALGFGINTIRKYWSIALADSESNQNDSKESIRKQREDKAIEYLNSLPVEFIRNYLKQRMDVEKKKNRVDIADDGFLFENDNYFIMKYDFETHTLEYYATIWEPFNDDVVPYLLIP